MFVQNKVKILYLVKAKNQFKTIKYMPYYYDDIKKFKKDLSNIGYTQINIIPYDTHTDRSDVAEQVLKQYLSVGDLESAQNCLKAMYDEQDVSV